MAEDRQRDGRNTRAGGRRRALHPDRTDPAQARRTVRPVRRRTRGGEIRSAALAVLGQSQAHELYGDLSILAGIYVISGPARPDLPTQAHRRFPWDTGAASTAPCLRHRRATDRGRYFDDRLFILPEQRN